YETPRLTLCARCVVYFGIRLGKPVRDRRCPATVSRASRLVAALVESGDRANRWSRKNLRGRGRLFFSDGSRRPDPAQKFVAPGLFHLDPRSLGPGLATLDEQHGQPPLYYDDAGARPRRHLASFAASVVAHAATVGLIVCFASPVARTHSEWVLAYLLEVGDSSSGRG